MGWVERQFERSVVESWAENTRACGDSFVAGCGAAKGRVEMELGRQVLGMLQGGGGRWWTGGGGGSSQNKAGEEKSTFFSDFTVRERASAPAVRSVQAGSSRAVGSKNNGTRCRDELCVGGVVGG